MNRNLICSIAFFSALALVVLGCGGGSSGGLSTTSSGGTTSGGGTAYSAETALSNGRPIDAVNLQVGDSATFQLVQTVSGSRQTLSVAGWTSTDPGGSIGILNSGGTFTATGAGGPFVASVTYGGATYKVTYLVNPAQPRLSGSILASGNSAAISGIKFLFFDASNNQVGSSVSGYDGSILASLPSTAVRFSLDPKTIDTSKFYSSFSFNGARYAPLIATCRAPLPALVGQSPSLPASVYLVPASNTPPGPPTGCLN